jgi:hypothetical protein
LGACFCDPGYEGDDCGILNMPQVKGQTKRGEGAPRLPGGPNTVSRTALGAIVTGGGPSNAQTAVHHNRVKHRLTFGNVLSGASTDALEEDEETKETKETKKEAHSNPKGSVGTAAADSSAAALRFKEVPPPSPDCLLNCTGDRGACTLRDGKELCDCAPGYHGTSCEYVEDCGTRGCDNDGVCRYGVCFCAPGFQGKHCTLMEPCPVADCGGNGLCRGGKCFCKPGFGGDGCERVETCPSNDEEGALPCSGHGVCSAGMCYCDEAHEGKGCESLIPKAKQCFQDCNSHGLCKQGRCFCAQGYAGVGCEIEVGATVVATGDLAANAANGANGANGAGEEEEEVEGGVQFTKFTLVVLGVGACVVGLIAGVVLVRKTTRKKKEEEYYYSMNGAEQRYEGVRNSLRVDAGGSENPFQLHSSI